MSRGIPWVHVEVAPEELIPVPLALFEIVDPTIPDVWEARISDAGDLLLWPAAFFSPGFHEKVYTGDETARASLDRLRRQLGADPSQ
jgi:hypothetical protein